MGAVAQAPWDSQVLACVWRHMRVILPKRFTLAVSLSSFCSFWPQPLGCLPMSCLCGTHFGSLQVQRRYQRLVSLAWHVFIAKRQPTNSSRVHLDDGHLHS